MTTEQHPRWRETAGPKLRDALTVLEDAQTEIPLASMEGAKVVSAKALLHEALTLCARNATDWPRRIH